MDKELSRILFMKNKIKTPKYFLLQKGNEGNLKRKIKNKKIKFPIVIKPVNEGSSLGVYICKNKIQFNKNYNKLKKEYNRILVEEYIPGKEIQVAVMGNKALGAIELVPSREFYDYKAKYSFKAKTKHIMPASLVRKRYNEALFLAKKAIHVVKKKKTNYFPTNWSKTYFQWMNNIQPWCISRQLWWGHRIPAWYTKDKKIFVAENENEANKIAKKYYKKKVELKRDEDVLDTWFSSALWPFATLGWPKKTYELKRFYPTSVLVTGFDIIFFWVARMMMMGNYLINKVPFSKVYVHALVRDEKGQKMSKSKGNVIDPLDIINKYGADSLRFTLISMAAPGRDVKLSEDRVKGYRNFLNKIWNANKFSKLNRCKLSQKININKISLDINKWIYFELVKTNIEAQIYISC